LTPGKLGDMTDLPNPSPLLLPVFITNEEARAVLEGLEPGWYRARDLYPRYEALTRAAGGRVGNAKALGEALSRAGVPRRTVHDHVSAYQVSA
jgi:hypothetical protein